MIIILAYWQMVFSSQGRFIFSLPRLTYNVTSVIILNKLFQVQRRPPPTACMPYGMDTENHMHQDFVPSCEFLCFYCNLPKKQTSLLLDRDHISPIPKMSMIHWYLDGSATCISTLRPGTRKWRTLWRGEMGKALVPKLGRGVAKLYHLVIMMVMTR